jgi:polysaccharide pyruvyl transferase WcaK-like protein
MKILHSYCLNFNIGDYALGIGLKNLLRSHLKVDLIGETNIQGREFNEYYIKEVVNKRYDLLVIGGGGIIHGTHWPNGWFWLINKELIKAIQIPFIVYGVGYNYWIDEGGIPERGIDHLKETFKHASFFSVRNDGSGKRLFEQTGINATEIPDPGFHVDINSEYKNFVNEPYVIVQIADDKPLHRYGSLEKRQQFIIDMREITKQLSKKYKLIYAPHVIDDIPISEEIIRGIHNTKIWEFGSFAFDHSDKAIGFYKYAEFAIAMRGHGQILPICFNTPVVSIENHPKHRGLMEELGLLEFNVKVSDPDFKRNLMAKINLLEVKKTDLIEKYKTLNISFMDASNKAFSIIKEKCQR